MPFYPNLQLYPPPGFRPYQAGDFIFGLDLAVDNFRDAQGQAAAGTVRVRDLRHKRAAVRKIKNQPRKLINTSYLNELWKHPKYHEIMIKEVGVDIHENELFREKSKGGLNFCVATGRFVHFVMDELNLREVSTKSYDGTRGGRPEFKNDDDDKFRTVTGAELRWIYRHRDHLDVQAHIQFWRGNAQVYPPWHPLGPDHGTPEGWQLYNPSHTYTASLTVPD